MPDDVPPFLICLTTRQQPKPLTPFTVKRLCSRCQTQVWLAPSGMALQREQGAVLLCIPCWAEDKASAGVKAAPLNAAQQREIVDATGAPMTAGDVEECVEWMRRQER